jgi:O-antigen ligase
MVFFISLIFYPIKNFWINRKKLIFATFISLIALLSTGAISNFVFRNNENKGLKYLKITSIEDLNNSDLGSFTSARSVIYYDAYNLISEKPFFGNGFLSWNDKNNNYNTLITSRDGGRISMHSTFLQYWAETGIVGLSLYLIYLSIILNNGRFLIKSPNKNKNYYIGKLIIYVSIFMLLGSLLDNHSLSYAQIHFVAALSIIFCNQKKNEEKNRLCY